jgi:uncharacterized protein YecT (DUF1311 family)
MKKICLAATMIAFAWSAHAAGNCEKPKTAFDNVYCESTLFSQADRELNQSYGTLRKQLSTAQQQSLKQGQIAWMRARDEQCSKQDSGGFMVNLECAVNMTQSRLNFLKSRERECLSTGCIDAKLSGQ